MTIPDIIFVSSHDAEGRWEALYHMGRLIADGKVVEFKPIIKNNSKIFDHCKSNYYVDIPYRDFRRLVMNEEWTEAIKTMTQDIFTKILEVEEY